jgi:hypothetical protein
VESCTRRGTNLNSLNVIHPYLFGDMWVFDDPMRGLIREPFVAGSNKIIEKMANGDTSVTITFSDAEFPGYDSMFVWVRSGMGGDWYYSPNHGVEGWLCPALLKYFPNAPKHIYAQVSRG